MREKKSKIQGGSPRYSKEKKEGGKQFTPLNERGERKLGKRRHIIESEEDSPLPSERRGRKKGKKAKPER